MRKKITTACCLLFATTLLFSCGASLKIPIDKNKVVSDITIELPDKNLILKPNEFFTLSETGLESNAPKINSWILQITKIDYAMKAFKKNEFISYNVIIRNPKYNKAYYGKLAFFNTSTYTQTSAVSRYREISIDNSYFENATRGRVAIMYEYASMPAGYGGSVKSPTWILLMSDEPI